MGELDAVERRMWFGFAYALFREWENSHYQNERGLFTTPEFEARRLAWIAVLRVPTFRQEWEQVGGSFSPSFRAEIGRIVAEVGG